MNIFYIMHLAIGLSLMRWLSFTRSHYTKILPIYLSESAAFVLCLLLLLSYHLRNCSCLSALTFTHRRNVCFACYPLRVWWGEVKRDIKKERTIVEKYMKRESVFYLDAIRLWWYIRCIFLSSHVLCINCTLYYIRNAKKLSVTHKLEARKTKLENRTAVTATQPTNQTKSNKRTKKKKRTTEAMSKCVTYFSSRIIIFLNKTRIR